MKHFLRSIFVMILCSVSMTIVNAESHEALEPVEESLVQCASCQCMVAAAKDLSRGVALCQCCSAQDEATRSVGCQCQQASVAQQCGAQKAVVSDVAECSESICAEQVTSGCGSCSKKKVNE